MLQVRDEQWLQLSELIAGKMGLHFSHERREDLERGIASAAEEFGFADKSACVHSLLTAPLTRKKLQVLASHLTVGETYFFRDRHALEALEDTILPDLIYARRGREQRIRIWSAACCSGEEAYSLAILLYQALPDLPDWQISITASDINPNFLNKAREGIYSEWSFRDAPVWLKERYFNRTADGRFMIIPEIRRMVNFTHLNLVEDVYPSLVNDTNAMDIIFCRNVLMYFTLPQVSKVIGKLHNSLVDGGWLAVSPSEASKALFPQFANINFPGAIFFQKGEKENGKKSTHVNPQSSLTGNKYPSSDVDPGSKKLVDEEQSATFSIKEVIDELQASAEASYAQGLYSEVTDRLLAGLAKYPVERHITPAIFSLMTRGLANQGRLDDALLWCDRWVASDKSDATGHYLRGMVLLEQGHLASASLSLQRAVYLQPGYVMAHFTLGNVAHAAGNMNESAKYFSTALRLLRKHGLEDNFPESEGLTAGRLIEFIGSVMAKENTDRDYVNEKN
jgi:chemotaxis protein methyltransferase CheR